MGASFWYQQSTNLGGAVTPSITGATQNDLAAMTTQGSFGFFSSNYGNCKGAAGGAPCSHLAPDGDDRQVGARTQRADQESGPARRVGHQSIDIEQYDDANTVNATLVRTMAGGGRLSGYGYYIEAFAWILGDVNFMDTPGLEPAPHIRTFRETPAPTWALMLAAKYDHVNFDVTGLPAQTDGTANPGAGSYRIDAFEFGANAWLTRHIRLTSNYIMNYIGGDAVNVTKNLFYHKPEHELRSASAWSSEVPRMVRSLHLPPRCLVALVLLAGCAATPLYPPRPSTTRERWPRIPPPSRVIIHLTLSSAGLRDLLNYAIPASGEGTFDLHGVHRYSWRRDPLSLRFADHRVEATAHVQTRVEVPILGAQLLTLDLRIAGEPVVTSGYHLRLQGATVEVASRDSRLRAAEWLAGALSTIRGQLFGQIEGLDQDLSPLVAEAHRRVAQPLPFQLGEGQGCANFRVTGLEAGPTVLADGIEKDLAIVIAPAVLLPCPTPD